MSARSQKRDQPRDSPSPSPSRAQDEPASKRAKQGFDTPRPLGQLKLHIVPAKLGPEAIADLIDLAEHEGAVVCTDPRDAEVLITNVGMRKRLERHVPWGVAVSVLRTSLSVRSGEI